MKRFNPTLEFFCDSATYTKLHSWEHSVIGVFFRSSGQAFPCINSIEDGADVERLSQKSMEPRRDGACLRPVQGLVATQGRHLRGSPPLVRQPLDIYRPRNPLRPGGSHLKNASRRHIKLLPWAFPSPKHPARICPGIPGFSSGKIFY